MVRLIMGANGAGKTKQLIDLIHSAVESENGSVVCIEPGADMTFDIKSSVRLVNGKEYNLNSFECLRGFFDTLKCTAQKRRAFYVRISEKYYR